MEELAKISRTSWPYVVGLALLFVSIFNVTDLTKLQVSPRSDIVWLGIVLGIGVILAGLATTLWRVGALPMVGRRHTSRKNDCWQAKFGRTEIRIAFGRLQDKAPHHPAKGAAVVLPASEFLDDHCLEVPRTACADYVKARFSDLPGFRGQLASARTDLGAGSRVEKEPGVFEISYGAGQCIFLREPLGTTPSIYLAAVSTKRAGTGLRSTFGHIDCAVENIIRRASDERLSSIYMPLMGAGEGGLSAHASFMALLLSLAIAIRRQAPGSLEAVTVVIYRADAQSLPALSPGTARDALEMVARMNAEWN